MAPGGIPKTPWSCAELMLFGGGVLAAILYGAKNIFK
jgi:hypothetical protein